MPSLFPREIDDTELRTSLSSLLGYRVLINSLSFFPAEDNSDYAQLVLRIGLRRQALIQPEEYQGLCAILLRYFRSEALTQENITIRDDFKILSLDKRHWVIGRFNNGEQITEAPAIAQDQMPEIPWHPEAMITDFANYQETDSFYDLNNGYYLGGYEQDETVDTEPPDDYEEQISDEDSAKLQRYFEQYGRYHPNAPFETEHWDDTEPSN